MADFTPQIQTLDNWISTNQDKKGTPQFEAIANDLRRLVGEQQRVPESRTYLDSYKDSASDFGEKMSADFLRRDRMATEIVAAQHAGEQTWAETAVQLTGKVGIGIISDVIFNGVVEGVQALTPDTVGEKVNDAATYAAFKILDNPVGEKGLEALYDGVETYQAWKAENPRMARNLEGVVNIGLVWTPKKGSPHSVGAGARNLKNRMTQRTRSLVDDVSNTGNRGVVRKAVDSLDTKVTNMASKERRARVIEALTPDEGLKNNTAMIEAGRMKEVSRPWYYGGGKNRVFDPSDAQNRAANDILLFSKGKPTDTALAVRNQAEESISGLQRLVDKTFEKWGGKLSKYNQDEFLERMGKLQIKVLKENEIALGAEQARNVSKLFDNAIDEVAIRPRTNKHLIKARIAHDKFAQKLKSQDKLYTTDQMDAIARTHNAIRREFNDFAAESTMKTAGRNADLASDLKNYLSRQSEIFKVLPTMTRNAALEPNKWIGQQLNKLNGFLGTRSLTTNVVAGMLGIGGLGAAALGGPVWTYGFAAPLLVIKGKKLAFSSVGVKALRDTIKATDKAIKIVGNPASYGKAGVYGMKQAGDIGITTAKGATELLTSLRADRAALIQLLEEGQE